MYKTIHGPWWGPIMSVFMLLWSINIRELGIYCVGLFSLTFPQTWVIEVFTFFFFFNCSWVHIATPERASNLGERKETGLLSVLYWAACATPWAAAEEGNGGHGMSSGDKQQKSPRSEPSQGPPMPWLPGDSDKGGAFGAHLQCCWCSVSKEVWWCQLESRVGGIILGLTSDLLCDFGQIISSLKLSFPLLWGSGHL